MTCNEIRRAVKTVFNEPMALATVRREMEKLPTGTSESLFVVLRLLAADRDERRAGNFSELVSFCRDEYPKFDLEQMAGDILTQESFVNGIRKAFPKERDVRQMNFTAAVLAEFYLRHLARRETAEPRPFFVIDGPSAIGKSTIVKKAMKILAEQNYPAICIGMDVFLKDLAWRQGEIAKIVSGQIEAETYDETAFFDVPAITVFLAELNDFRLSGEKERILRVENAFDQKTKLMGRREFKLVKGEIFLIEGKYANLAQLQSLYGPEAFRTRLQKTEATIREQFIIRGGKDFTNNQRMAFYDAFLQNSFRRYAALTAKFVNGVLNMEPQDEIY